MDDDPEVSITAYSPIGWPLTAPVQPDRSWVTRVPASWPAAGAPGAGVADTAFAAVEASFLAAPPAAEYLHPLRVDRVGDTALLVFGWRSDPRWFTVRVDLPTRLEEVDDGPGVVIGSGPVDWADAVAGWLEEELLTGAIHGRSHREGDLVVLDIGARPGAEPPAGSGWSDPTRPARVHLDV